MVTWIAAHPFLVLTLSALVIGIIAFARGLFAGYPAKRLAPSVLSAKEQAIVSVCADALFPSGGELPLSGTEAGVLPFFDSMLRELPRQNRLLIRALLFLLEHGPWVLNRRPRLTKQTPTQRVQTLDAWSQSRFYLLRTAFIGIRALLTMAYLENYEVACKVGHLPNLDPFASKVAA